ncbi:hypothetical protein ACFW2V_13900 [Streptomyces sp. NPDC058947]|uniref:hypothetical protein n=1 Tax=Streptomyces sp. NPDC058947 TaxID=3346675 RepID=UPI00367AF7DF
MKSDHGEIARELVDPATAARWLAGVPVEFLEARLRSARIILDLVREMRAGLWVADPEDAVVLDQDGIVCMGLVDLTAVVYANVRVWMYVQRDAPRSEWDRSGGATQPDLKDFARTNRINRA